MIDKGLIVMSTRLPTNMKEPENDPQRISELKVRRAHYKSPEFREAITDAFHKAKLHVLDDLQITTALAHLEAKE